MNAKKFLHKKDVAYMNRLSTSLDFDRIASLMEEYAALRIHDVVRQNEQLKAFLSVMIKEFDSGGVSWETRDSAESLLKNL